ncbi:MAG: molybdopterin-dependent oxidoreductase [Chloroflexota bacterium]
MKKFVVIFLMLSLLLVACTSGEAETGEASGLIVGVKTYSAADLRALPVSEATFKDKVYKGVAVTTLLEDAGYSLDQLQALKAVAADGYSVNYDLPLIQKADVIVAYAQVDGPLTAEDGQFRMVLPEEEGKLNVRMLAELQVAP